MALHKAMAKDAQEVCMNSTWNGVGIPVVVGFLDGAAEVLKRCRAERKPFIFIDHGYLHRNAPIYDKFRLCVNHFHTTDWRDSNNELVKYQPWKKDGRNIIVLPPTHHVMDVFQARGWLQETMRILSKHTDRPIIIKEKTNGKLAEMLQDAFAVVSYGSVGEVEAALNGVPVFTTVGPSLPIAQTDFTQIEAPIYPDREPWMRCLAGAEWSLDQAAEAWQRIKPLLRDTNPRGVAPLTTRNHHVDHDLCGTANLCS